MVEVQFSYTDDPCKGCGASANGHYDPGVKDVRVVCPDTSTMVRLGSWCESCRAELAAGLEDE